MDEFFIECVQQYPCLWNTKLASYKQLDVKDAAWKDIIKKTKIASVTLAKIKWKHLRDIHRENLKKIKKTKSGPSRKNIKPWKYTGLMEFLLPYMTKMERDTNVTSHPDISTRMEETANAEVSRDSADSITVPKNSKMDEIIHKDEDTLRNILKEMEDNREKRTAQRDELRKEVLTLGDPLKAFFESMYQSTKQMPEFHQRTIKRNLFQSVMDAEEIIANTNWHSYSGYNSNNNAYNSRPSSNSSEHASTYLPEPSGSGLQQIKIEGSPNEETQDSMAAIEITLSDETSPTTRPTNEN